MRETVPNLCHDAQRSRQIADFALEAPTRPTSSAAKKINKNGHFCEAIDVNDQGTSGDNCAVSVPAVQRELSAWFMKTPHTPKLLAAFEDVMLGLDCYRLNRQIMSPAMMRGLAESVERLERAVR
jgi:hypothetical protein